MRDTLRLLMPQWQGGDNPAYSFGAKLLAWLAPPKQNAIEIEVPVQKNDGEELVEENGIIGRSVLIKQLDSATKILEAFAPERVIVFGGDCLVSQAPFAYLNERYGGNLGVLWIDAHPDISTPAIYNHAHAMVLGNLLGEGDAEFAARVKFPVAPERVLYAGLQEVTSEEGEIIDRLGLQKVSSQELARSNEKVVAWIKENKIQHLAIHLDLDVLDPSLFRSLLFANINNEVIDAPSGKMSFEQVSSLIKDASQATDLVGLSIAEHLPWDDLNLHNFLEEIPIFY